MESLLFTPNSNNVHFWVSSLLKICSSLAEVPGWCGRMQPKYQWQTGALLSNQQPKPQCLQKLQYSVTVSPSFGKSDCRLSRKPREMCLWFPDDGVLWVRRERRTGRVPLQFNRKTKSNEGFVFPPSTPSSSSLPNICFTWLAQLLVWKATVCFEKTSEDE